MEEIDIIVVTYNHEHYIEDCLNSITNQNYTNFVIHIIDDCSTDNTRKILLEAQSIHPEKIKLYFNNTNQGSVLDSIVFNELKLRGKYWCLIEGDDYWVDDNKLKLQILRMQSNENIIACSTLFNIKNEMVQTDLVDGPNIIAWNYLDLVINKNSYVFFSHISTIMWRNIYENEICFLPKYYLNNSDLKGDLFLMHVALMANLNFQMVNLPIVTSCYRYTGKGIWSSLDKNTQDSINVDLISSISSRIPLRVRIQIIWYKIINKLYLSKFLKIAPLNQSTLSSLEKS
jgi:glycosyltransferase involved in cell wall biosynthesis